MYFVLNPMRFYTAVWWRWKSRPPPYSASWSWDGPGCQQSPLPSPRWSQSPSKNTVFNDIKVNVRTITSIFQDGNIITVHRWLIFMYLHHFISTDAAITIDIIEVKRPDNLRRNILVEKFFCEKEEVPLVKTSNLLCQYNTAQLSHKQTMLWREFKPYPSETLCL